MGTVPSAVCEGTRRPTEGEADGLGAGEGTGAGAELVEGMDQVKGQDAGLAGGGWVVALERSRRRSERRASRRMARVFMSRYVLGFPTGAISSLIQFVLQVEV